MDDGLREHEDLVREHFRHRGRPSGTPVRRGERGGVVRRLLCVHPQGVKLEQPLQAYFRINEAQMGQFERTLIIVEEGAQVQYIEGCTAPSYAQDSFHSGVIEIIVKDNARCRYTTIQNWSHNVYNLVTQRAVVGAHGTMGVGGRQPGLQAHPRSTRAAT